MGNMENMKGRSAEEEEREGQTANPDQIFRERSKPGARRLCRGSLSTASEPNGGALCKEWATKKTPQKI